MGLNAITGGLQNRADTFYTNAQQYNVSINPQSMANTQLVNSQNNETNGQNNGGNSFYGNNSQFKNFWEAMNYLNHQ